MRVAAASVPGAVHLRTGRPNQDAVAWLPLEGDGERVVMAVSDGHGSAASPRSELGAAFAVDLTTSVLWGLPQPASEESVRVAVARIATKWDERVRRHLERHPLSPVELERIGARSDADPIISERPGVVYGATLLFAVVSGDEVALGQLGDGDVLIVDATGLVERPLPADARLVAHVTTSLSDEDPVGNTRTRILAAAEHRLVLLSTDGYANSFATDEAFLQVGRDFLRTVDDAGIGSVRGSLPQWLAETTSNGAGDDISVALAVLDAPRVQWPRPTAGSHAPARSQ